MPPEIFDMSTDSAPRSRHRSPPAAPSGASGPDRAPADTADSANRAVEVGLRVDSVEDLAVVNRIVESAVRGWGVPERVLRLALPSFRYGVDDLRHMTVVLACVPRDGAVGVAAWEPGSGRDAPAGRTALLLHGLFVAPASQGRGIGKRLLVAAAEAAASLGLDGITVRAWREAEGFFRTRGFTPVPGSDPGDEHPPRLWRSLG
jgi:GNAT superfamily N-acetyltransferase